jgi:hypothetical protein
MRGRSAFRFRIARDVWLNLFKYTYPKSFLLSRISKKRCIVVIYKVRTSECLEDDFLSITCNQCLLQVSYGYHSHFSDLNAENVGGDW